MKFIAILELLLGFVLAQNPGLRVAITSKGLAYSEFSHFFFLLKAYRFFFFFFFFFCCFMSFTVLVLNISIHICFFWGGGEGLNATTRNKYIQPVLTYYTCIIG